MCESFCAAGAVVLFVRWRQLKSCDAHTSTPTQNTCAMMRSFSCSCSSCPLQHPGLVCFLPLTAVLVICTHRSVHLRVSKPPHAVALVAYEQQLKQKRNPATTQPTASYGLADDPDSNDDESATTGGYTPSSSAPRLTRGSAMGGPGGSIGGASDAGPGGLRPRRQLDPAAASGPMGRPPMGRKVGTAFISSFGLSGGAQSQRPYSIPASDWSQIV